MELKMIIHLLKRNIKLIIAVTIICILFFVAAGVGMEVLNSGSEQEENEVNMTNTETIPFEANVFTAASYVSFKIDYSDLPFSLNNDAESLLEYRYIKTTGAAIAYLQTNPFYISILKKYEENISLNNLRRHVSAHIFPNSTYIYFAANGFTSEEAVLLANLAADTAIDTLQNAVDGIYDIKLMGRAINEYSEEDIELLLEIQKEIIEDFNSIDELFIKAGGFNVRRMPVFLILGFILGLVVAVCITFLKEYMSPYFSDSSKAANVLGVEILAEFNQASFKKSVAHMLNKIKTDNINVVSVMSIGGMVCTEAIIKEIALSDAYSKVLIVSNKEIKINSAKNIKTVTVSADKTESHIKEAEITGKYDIIIADGGSLQNDSYTWDLLNPAWITLGVVTKSNTKIATAQNIARQLNSIDCKLSGIIWTD